MSSPCGVAVVTGGASGLGRAIGERCAARGYALALLDIDGQRAGEQASEIAAMHGLPVLGRRVDVGDAANVEAAAVAVAAELGDADLVFSNVGVQQIGAMETFPDEAWTWMLDVNVIGAARVARSFLTQLRRSTNAHLAFTASSSVLAPASQLAAYQASKFALLGLADSLRVELADDGIKVSTVFPSAMFTRHLETSLQARPDRVKGEIAPETAIQKLIESSPYISDGATAEVAASAVLDEILDDHPYIVTHGNLVEAVERHHVLLQDAASRARDRVST
jgi:NAD(P)-dependent dehydrogenase (short-subunit alcohol dehydrogenase family)